LLSWLAIALASWLFGASPRASCLLHLGSLAVGWLVGALVGALVGVVIAGWILIVDSPRSIHI
jgi:hypothetical protein